MKVLITGISGFAGSHLAEHLLQEGYEVYGLIRNTRTDLYNLRKIREKVSLIECDITDFYSVERALQDARPEYIFHLAAQSFVPSSWRAPVETISTNFLGTLHLFEAILKLSLDPTILIACTSEEYGLVHPDEVPIKETNPLRPMSPYAVSKVSMDYLGYQYFKSYGLKVIRTRTFNHTGPRRGEQFVVSTFAKQIVEIENGKEPILRVGNLEAKRDFSDVRDIVRAYLLAVKHCDPGDVYNIASGETHKIQDVLDYLLSQSNVKVQVQQDPKRMRPSDVPILLGNCDKFKEKTNWKPVIPFEKTLKDTLEFWREKIGPSTQSTTHSSR